MGKKKPVVNNGRLTAYDTETGLPYSVRVGSKRWYGWLANNKTFIFDGEAGHFSARREMRRGMPYWYAYRRREGKLCKAYLGKAEELDRERLDQISARLSGQGSAPRLPVKPNSHELMASIKKAMPASVHNDESTWSTTPFLLATRVKPPALPPNLITRPRLIRRMTKPLTLIYAPSGFGKSTLLNEWRSQYHIENRKTAWVSLDADDNEPGHFWMVVVSALQTVRPEFGRNLSSHLSASAPTAIRQMMVSLINEIVKVVETPDGPHLIALILDDYHHVQSDAIHQSVCFLLDHLPSALQLIISGHTKPPFALGKLRSKGLVAELNAKDLRFTIEEGVDFLQRQMPNNPLAFGEMQALVKQTEGWIAGLNLAALALNRQADKRRFMATFAGGHTYLHEYFMEDVLQRQLPSMQAFLLKTSILKHLTADLCDAVTEQENGQQMLQRLWQENLFLTQLGEGQDWYRYHDLFAQALHSQLQTQFADEIPQLHRRAARWYQARDAPADAVRHLLALEAWEEAAILIEGVALRELQQQGEDSRLLRWLKQLPYTVMQQHKTLLSVYIRLAKIALSQAEVTQFLQRVEQSIVAKPIADQTPSEQEVLIEIGRIRNLQAAGKPLPLRIGATKAFADVWQMMDLLVECQIFLRQLAHDEAEAAAFRALEMGQARDNLFVILIAGGSAAHSAILQGHLRRSEQLVHQLLQWVLAKRDTLPEPASILLMALSRVYFERNQLAQARQLLSQASEVDPNPTSSNSPVMTYILLARIQTAQGEIEAAQATIQAALHLNKERPSGIWTDPDLKAYQALICVQQGDLAEAERLLNELEDTEIHDLTMVVRAEVLLAQEQYILAENTLTTLIEQYPHSLKNEPLLGARLMLAMSLFGEGKVNQARRVMVKAVRLAGPEEFIRPFLDRGSQIAPLLTLVLHTEKLTAETQQFVKNTLQTLKKTYGARISIPKKEFIALSTAASISKQEQKVLQLVSAGLSNREIAERLFVSDSTVKTHVKNIYRKLEVNSRVLAVERARALKLL